ncbi:hypothetical protein [Robbsia sp. KACC 23696]|uniref:hypothetical protein n=1 Tax=Robbsia sp. KACC 23696 TaxID=3149231 RepID=UPI00325AA346
MEFLTQMGSMSLNSANLILLLPMALVGVVLAGNIPYHHRAAHYSLEIGGAVLGVVVALGLLTLLQIFI